MLLFIQNVYFLFAFSFGCMYGGVSLAVSVDVKPNRKTHLSKERWRERERERDGMGQMVVGFTRVALSSFLSSTIFLLWKILYSVFYLL